MRIIAGKFRGRRLISPRDATIRPTTDRLRESIFNVLAHRLGTFEGTRVADIFAGTGAFGLEAASRGAAFITFIEKHRQSLELIRQNLDQFDIKDKADILIADARNLPNASNPYNVIFMDPPYGKGLAEPTLQSLISANWIAPTGLVIVERAEEDIFEFPDQFEAIKKIKQGKRRVQFLQLK